VVVIAEMVCGWWWCGAWMARNHQRIFGWISPQPCVTPDSIRDLRCNM